MKVNLPAPLVDRSGWPYRHQVTTSRHCRKGDSSLPKISVVIPSLNQGDFLEAAIRSVLLQSYPNLELILIDGGSTDNSLEIVQHYKSWLAYWVSEPDRGQSHAVNKGVAMSSGDILLWLNSDDICLPDAFWSVVRIFAEQKQPSMVVGQAKIIDQDGMVTGDLNSYFTSWEELVTNPRNSIRQVSTFFPRRVFQETGLLNETLFVAMDTDLMVRFTRHHTPIVVQDYFTAYRIHSDAKTANYLLNGYQESDKYRRQYLTTRSLLDQYRKRSAANWMSLADSENFRLLERLTCLKRAVLQYPLAALNRSYWSTLKGILCHS